MEPGGKKVYETLMKKIFQICIVVTALFAGFSGAFAQPSVEWQTASNTLVGEGDMALADGDLPRALRFYEQAVVSNPQNIEAYIGLGRLYMNARILADSLKYFDIALTLEPTHLGTLELQSYAFLTTDAVDDARSNLAKMEQICFDRDCDETNRVSQAIEDHLSEVQ